MILELSPRIFPFFWFETGQSQKQCLNCNSNYSWSYFQYVQYMAIVELILWGFVSIQEKEMR